MGETSAQALVVDPLDHTNIVIVVFAMPGCPACSDYLPRLHRQLDGYVKLGHPFIVHDGQSPIPSRAIPVLIYDATAKDQSVQDFANKHSIVNLPTTILLPKIGWPAKYEGSLTDGQIYNLLNAAIATNR